MPVTGWPGRSPPWCWFGSGEGLGFRVQKRGQDIMFSGIE
jgi:hypothetical protein